MKNQKQSLLTTILTAAGIFLLLAAVMLTVLQVVGQKTTSQRNAELVEHMYAVMPAVHVGALDDRVDMTMPVLEVDGEDLIGILELPLYDRTLPVGGNWSKYTVSTHPCRYSGNLYDGSLVIGGSDAPGQFDFMKSISIGNSISLTDAMGGRYYYRVEWVENRKDIPLDELFSETTDLVLFARNSYSMEYTIVQCSLQMAEGR